MGTGTALAGPQVARGAPIKSRDSAIVEADWLCPGHPSGVIEGANTFQSGLAHRSGREGGLRGQHDGRLQRIAPKDLTYFCTSMGSTTRPTEILCYL